MGVVTPVREFRADRQKLSNSRAVSGRPPERRRGRCSGRSGRRPNPDALLGRPSVRSPMFSGSRRGAVPQSLVVSCCSCPRTREPHRSLGTSNRLSPLHRGRPRLSAGEYRAESCGERATVGPTKAARTRRARGVRTEPRSAVRPTQGGGTHRHLTRQPKKGFLLIIPTSATDREFNSWPSC